MDETALASNIDDLPAVILEHILSLVPMKDAVRTRKHFTDFVGRVLFLRGSSRIKRFDLTGCFPEVASRVDLWVSGAVTRNVEELFLNLSWLQGNFVLPYCLFTCATLTHFKLSNSGALKLPFRIFLPNLKFLHLENITFVDERLTEQLLSSPVLEELSIEYCNWDNLETLTIRAPKLKILTINDRHLDRSYPYSCRVLICGNNLRSIHCTSQFLNDYQFEKSSSLLEVRIDVPNCWPSRTRQVAHRLHKLLEAVCSVKELMLSSAAFEVLSSVDELCSHLPAFPNLKLVDFERLDLKQQAIVKLLHNSPNLETLEFSGGIKLHPSDEEDGATIDPAPRCFGSHLKQIDIGDVLPCEEEVRVLELLLKHAVVLEKLMIWPLWDLPGSLTKEMFHEKLLEICCGSKSLEFVIF